MSDFFGFLFPSALPSCYFPRCPTRFGRTLSWSFRIRIKYWCIFGKTLFVAVNQRLEILKVLVDERQCLSVIFRQFDLFPQVLRVRALNGLDVQVAPPSRSTTVA